MIKNTPLYISIIIIISCVLIKVYDPPIITQSRHQIFDSYQTFSPRSYEQQKVTIIDIDEKSLSRFGQWLWTPSPQTSKDAFSNT